MNTNKNYVKKDPISHMLLRPAMYIGDTSLQNYTEFIAINDYQTNDFKIINKTIQTSPGFLRVFIEILSNAIDNYIRSVDAKITCSYIKVFIDKKTGETTIINDGDFIPIEINKEEKMYNHSLIFGHLLSGSNFNDEEDRQVSGLNGIGSTACNIFSTKFIVKSLDPVNKLTFEQTWTNNMRTVSEPIIGKVKTGKAFTQITYFPDFEKFGLKGYTDDIISQYMKYILDTAILTKVKVYFNDELIPINNLLSYSKLFDSPTEENIYIKHGNSEVVVTPATEFEAITFVNGIFTKLGGTHLDAWSDAIFRPILDKLNGKKAKPSLNIKDVRQFFRIFIITTVNNPRFESQSKNKLESPKVDADVKSSDINKIWKWSVISDLQDIIKSKEMISLKKSEKKKKGYTKIEGLDNANFAGTKQSHLCSLILSEGLSAKTYAVAGLSKGVYERTGRDYFGILCLTGKILNCRNATLPVISKNKVITNLIQALGLQFNTDYTDDKNYKTLSYGRVILLTDADCFTDDTSLLIKRNDMVSIIQMSDLYNNEWNIDTQLVDDTYVWSDSGWVKVKAIRQKKTNKRILTINTYSGLIRCTEDHTLLLENNKEIKAKDIKVGDKLLRNRRISEIPTYDDSSSQEELKEIMRKLQCFNDEEEDIKNQIENELKYCSKYEEKSESINMSSEEAWIWGLFFGYCAYESNKNSFVVSNCDYSKLQKAQEIINSLYENVTITEDNKIIIDDNKKGFIANIRNQIYTKNGLKKVPDVILNNSIIHQPFFEGLGDANKEEYDILGQVGAQGLCYIVERLGYSYNIKEKNYKPDVFTVQISKRYRRFYPGNVKSIYETEYKDRFVYDIETETGRINAGIGNMVQRQCDGIHISGLIMNFFHFLFPSLLKRSSPYLVSMQTPIVRVFNKGSDILFYDENKFKEFVKNQTKPFKSKYYKGLGTTKTEDVPDTFGEKMVEYIEDINTNTSINKVFHKKFSDDRKRWLEDYNPNPEFSLDDGGKLIKMNMSSFLNNEVIKFSIDDCKRSIPTLYDGLKESQRKVLYAVKKRNLTSNKQSLKVAQLGGYVAEKTNYHHGEQNLYQTITKMAHEFPGTNNIPLLYRDGQFGCLDPETLILMWDGRTKKAKDIEVGDNLIGDDGFPRTVKQLTEGVDEMYHVIQTNGKNYTVNSQHILTLSCEMHKNIWWSNCANSWVVSYYDEKLKKIIDYDSKIYENLEEKLKDIPDSNIFDIRIDDYMNMPEKMRCKFKGLKCNTHIKWKRNESNLLNTPYEMGVMIRNLEWKYISPQYIYTNKNSRLDLLRGFIDNFDESYERYYEVNNKYKHVFDSLEQICNSLGYHVTKTNTTLFINVNPRNRYYSISVKPAWNGKFVGWSVDGNERFLLGDYTVTHNSRLSGGHDAAAARYIFTKMETLTPLLFRDEDDILLDYVEDDGDILEPKFYVPILPTILINGCTAIGTGWSSDIPCYNPLDVIECVKIWLDNDGEILLSDPDDEGDSVLSLLPSIKPWYRGFIGEIEEKDGQYLTYGVLSKETGKSNKKVTITELPIGMWTDKFKEYCEDLLVEKDIKSLHNESTPQKVKFIITESEDGVSCNLSNMKLLSYLNVTNMVLFNDKYQLRKYSVDEIINEFCTMRYHYYKKRKIHLVQQIEKELQHLGNKARFIEEVIEKRLIIMNVEEDAVVQELHNRKYDKENINSMEDEEGSNGNKHGYEYLLRMHVRVFTKNQIIKLKNDIMSQQKKLSHIKSISEKKMWLNDIEEFEIEYHKWLKTMEKVGEIKKKK